MKFGTIIDKDTTDFILWYFASHQPENIVQNPEYIRLSFQTDALIMNVTWKLILDCHKV